VLVSSTDGSCSVGDGFVEVPVLRCRAILVVAGEGRGCMMNLLVLWQQDWSNWMVRILVHVANDNVLLLVMSEFITDDRS
jgi:hypothetical protein